MAYPGRYMYLFVFVVVGFTLNRVFYPATVALPPMFFLIIHPREILTIERYKFFCRHSETEKNQSRESIEIGKSSANVPSTRACQKRHPRNSNYEKNINKYSGVKERNSEMRQHGNDPKKERTRTTYVLAESSSRWLLHRRRNKKINMPT